MPANIAAMRLVRTERGAVLDAANGFHPLTDDWDSLINHPSLADHLRAVVASGQGVPRLDQRALAPIGSQEVWAAGVTYYRSRVARAGESKASGGSVFYDRVYDAQRPELFFKAAAWRVRGPEDAVRIRADSKWNVPEPELALCVNCRGQIVGYTIGNDMSSRDIEGENPLYLPQAKIYDGACSLGPSMLVADRPLRSDTTIGISVRRGGEVLFDGATTIAQMKRKPEDLVGYLFRETSFPAGCVLLTGTGIVPPDNITLRSGDRIRIEVAGIGVLENTVE